MKNRIPFSYLVAVLLPVSASYVAWPADARGADEASPEAMSAEKQGPAAKTGLPFAGQLSSLFRINDSDPESGVPTPKQRDSNPLEFGYYLQDLLAKAEHAAEEKDGAAVIRYYRALSIAVPNQARGWSLLCKAYEEAKDWQRAINACKYAIDREGAALEDFVRFVHLMLDKADKLSVDERAVLNDVLTHVEKQPGLTVPAAHLRCEAAVKLKDTQAMEACTGVLAKAAPDDPKTIVFQWSLAVMRGQRDEAARLLGQAEKAGVAVEKIEQMRRVAPGRLLSSRFIGMAGLGGAILLLATLLLRRRVAATRRA